MNLMKILKKAINKEPTFDWSEVPRISEDEVNRWMSAVNVTDRQFPLAVALQVHDEYEHKLMTPNKLDALQLAEIRGALKALSRFSTLFVQVMTSKKRKDGEDA